MIIEFTVGNFRSFKEMQTLSMVAAPIKSKEKKLDSNNVFKINEKLSLLRSKAIYGANASGKSNVIRAIFNFDRMVRSSVIDDSAIQKACDDFVLTVDVERNPIFYQLVFSYGNNIYRYGFEVKNNVVKSEWLYSRGFNVKEVRLFTREEEKVIVSQTHFKEAKKFENLTTNGESSIFQKHSLFLTATAAVGVKISKELQITINTNKIVEHTELVSVRNYGKNWWAKEENRSKAIDFLKSADIGIEDIGINEVDTEENRSSTQIHSLNEKTNSVNRIQLSSLRKIHIGDGEKEILLEAPFDLFESEGTKKFFYLAPFILNALNLGTCFWIDEFDARLHPLLTKKIVSLFNSPETNPKGAQLIFATHDTNMLKPSFLRRDQICFVEKDKYGASHLKTLVEIKGIRNDASYDKDYLQGRYGAVPFLNELDEAVQKSIADEPEH